MTPKIRAKGQRTFLFLTLNIQKWLKIEFYIIFGNMGISMTIPQRSRKKKGFGRIHVEPEPKIFKDVHSQPRLIKNTGKRLNRPKVLESVFRLPSDIPSPSSMRREYGQQSFEPQCQMFSRDVNQYPVEKKLEKSDQNKSCVDFKAQMSQKPEAGQEKEDQIQIRNGQEIADTEDNGNVDAKLGPSTSECEQLKWIQKKKGKMQDKDSQTTRKVETQSHAQENVMKIQKEGSESKIKLRGQNFEDILKPEVEMRSGFTSFPTGLETYTSENAFVLGLQTNKAVSSNFSGLLCSTMSKNRPRKLIPF